LAAVTEYLAANYVNNTKKKKSKILFFPTVCCLERPASIFQTAPIYSIQARRVLEGWQH